MLSRGDKFNLKRISNKFGKSEFVYSMILSEGADLAGVEIDTLHSEVGPGAVHQAPAAARIHNLQHGA